MISSRPPLAPLALSPLVPGSVALEDRGGKKGGGGERMVTEGEGEGVSMTAVVVVEAEEEDEEEGRRREVEVPPDDSGDGCITEF